MHGTCTIGVDGDQRELLWPSGQSVRMSTAPTGRLTLSVVGVERERAGFRSFPAELRLMPAEALALAGALQRTAQAALSRSRFT